MNGLTLSLIVGSFCVLAGAFVAIKRMRRVITRRTAELYVTRMDLDQGQSQLRCALTELDVCRKHYRAMFSNTRDIVLVYSITEDDLPGKLVEVNDVACEKLGYTREKLQDMSLLDIEVVRAPSAMMQHSRLHDVDNTVGELSTLADGSRLKKEPFFPIRQRMRQIAADKQAVHESDYRTAHGPFIPVEVSSHLFELDGVPMVISMAHDIAHRKETESALRETERAFHDFFTHSPLGVAMYTAEHHLKDVNQSFLKMFGIPDRDAFALFDIFNCTFLNEEARGKVSNGESIRCEMAVDFDDVRGRMLFVSSRRGTACFDLLINNLGFDADFNPKGHLVQVMDVTQRRQTEAALRQRDQELLQAQNMEAVGTLVGGIAHDFNNILTPILGYAELARDSVDVDADVGMYMQEILKASNRAKDLVQQIITFSRRSDDESKRRPAHIIPILNEVLALLRGNIAKTITINRVIKTDKDVVLCDPTQIHQIIMNLCTNARHAMAVHGGVLDVRITDFMSSDRDGEFAKLHPGRYIRISVGDTGTGMDSSTLERIFEPFFTTKCHGKGTGMGLSVVHGIVTALGGAIRVDTEIDKGSTFHVVLPVKEQSSEIQDEAPEMLPRGTEGTSRVHGYPGIPGQAHFARGPGSRRTQRS